MATWKHLNIASSSYLSAFLFQHKVSNLDFYEFFNTNLETTTVSSSSIPSTIFQIQFITNAIVSFFSCTSNNLFQTLYYLESVHLNTCKKDCMSVQFFTINKFHRNSNIPLEISSLTEQLINFFKVDFQLCVYGSPAIDLLYFLNTSPSDEVLGNHRSTLIAEYLKVLFATMQKIGCTTTAPTMNELKHSIQKREIYGFVAASTILPIVLVNKDDAPDLEEIMNSGETEVNNKAYANEAYRKTMARRLPYWDELGLFNV